MPEWCVYNSPRLTAFQCMQLTQTDNISVCMGCKQARIAVAQKAATRALQQQEQAQAALDAAQAELSKVSSICMLCVLCTMCAMCAEPLGCAAALAQDCALPCTPPFARQSSYFSIQWP